MAATSEEIHQKVSNIPEKYKINFIHAINEKRLNLAGKEMSDSEFMEYVIPFLKKNPEITNLYIPRNKLTDESAMAIAAINTLDTLIAGNNLFGDEGVVVIANHPKITTLDISANKFGKRGVEALASNRIITNLHINSINEFGDFGAIVFSKNRTLKFLDVSYNKITDEGAKAFANNESIETLVLDYNLIGDEAVTAIAKNETIIVLSISCGLNHAKPISDESAIALSHNKVLRKLNISSNHLTNTGVTALSKNQFEALDISYNPTGSPDLIDYAVLKSLTENLSLSTLNIGGKTSEKLSHGEKDLLLSSDKYRKNQYKKEKIAFLSVITLTDHKTDHNNDKEKKASLLFQYCFGMKQPNSAYQTDSNTLENRLTEDLLKHTFSFMRPKPLKVEV